MPSELARRDIRWARIGVWWRRWDLVIYLAGMFLCGIFVGLFAGSFADRADRIELLRRHDDDIREFRLACRRAVDERDAKIVEAMSAATEAAKAAANAYSDKRR